MSTHEIDEGGGRLARLCATLGGIGYCRPASGTWASVAIALLALAWIALAPGAWIQPGFIAAAALSLGLGLAVVPSASRHFIDEDPGQVVIDEAAGLFAALAVLPGSLLAASPLVAVVAAFVFFRLLDIAKPWPVLVFDRMRQPYGVMSDDVFAGLIAGMLVLPLLA